MNLLRIFYDFIHVYQNALKVDSKNINALVGIASALYIFEIYDEEINYYDEILIVDLNNKNVKNDLFSLSINLGNYEAQFSYFHSTIAYFD